MYYIPLLIMFLFCVFENRSFKNKDIYWRIAFGILLLMLCLRYGQGTDYFGYKWNYLNGDTHSEKGFVFIQQIFRSMGAGFEELVFVISLFQMFCIYRALKLFSPYKSMSLLLLYPTIYLTYFFSALRQGIVIAFFLGFMLKWLLDGKWIRYFAACIIMASIHSISLVLIPLAAVVFLKRKHLYCVVFLVFFVGGAIYFLPPSVFSFVKIGSFQYYINSFSISYMGILERAVLFGIVVVLWELAKKNIEPDDGIEIIYKIYLCGFAISILFFPWALMSSRLPAALKATEIILIPMLLYKNVRARQIITVLLMCYVLVMTTKNLSMYISQGGYKNCNVVTYPYISVFNKELEEIRVVGYEFEE